MTTSARIESILSSFASFIEPSSRIIDIGAGKGLLAQELVNRFDARVTMVDVAQYNQTKLPLTLCDSRALSFAGDSFDYAILSFVLHHSTQPDAIMREALRVARHSLVIENDVRGRIRGMLTRAIDSWPAVQFGTPPCFFSKSREEWMEWFQQFAVDIQVMKQFSLEFGFFKCFTVQLEKK